MKNFLPETIFLVDGEVPVPATPATESITSEAAPIVTVPQPEKPVAPKAVPAIPKLPKTEAPAVPAKYKIIGENRKGIAVLVTIPDAQYQQLPQLEFLNKILAAIGLQPTDVAYVNNVSGELAVFEELQQALQVNYILSFASRVESNLPHEKFTLYNPAMLGSVPIVFSHALVDIEKDQDKKRLLWGALQKVFK
ncbi:hypothetical protein WG947_06150 [Pontibacter sp. H259]|uniref:hypothetical protein n=1 Tax=Pontibacter sp. H259 TaxID=3133421 RepID=UPI0030BAC17C